MLPLMLALSLLQQKPQAPTFKFAKDQRVYIVAVNSNSRDASVTKADLGLERAAKDQFKKRKAFRIASTIRDADLVFFVVLDLYSQTDEVALVVLPSDYQNANGNLDALRNAALWQSANHFKNELGEAAMAVGSLGISTLFHNPNVVGGLIKKFHRDALGK